jgi:hypothetical protein
MPLSAECLPAEFLCKPGFDGLVSKGQKVETMRLPSVWVELSFGSQFRSEALVS